MVKKTDALCRIYPKWMYYREVYPLQLKNVIRDKSMRFSGQVCTNEFSQLVGCMKKSDFNDAVCRSEFAAYTKCVEEYQVRKEKEKEQMKSGLLGGEGRRVSSAQLNNLMKQWPQPDVTSKHSQNSLFDWKQFYPSGRKAAALKKENRERKQPKEFRMKNDYFY